MCLFHLVSIALPHSRARCNILVVPREIHTACYINTYARLAKPVPFVQQENKDNKNASFLLSDLTTPTSFRIEQFQLKLVFEKTNPL